MIKFIVAAVWICAVTAGAAIYSFQNAGKGADAEQQKPMLGGLDYISADIISVPMVKDATIQGYFLTKLVYTVEPHEVAKMSVPIAALITDQVYSYLYTNPQTDFANTADLDLDSFRNNIRQTINQRIGADIIHDVLIDQVNFLSKDEIRDNAVRRREKPAPASGKTAEAETPKAH